MPSELRREFDAIRNTAIRLSGGLGDLSQRAAVYHHVYVESGGNHVFPLIAAHGALWARRYFLFGLRLGRWLSLPYVVRPSRRRELHAALETFADAFREVNRHVCVDTYTLYHFTQQCGDSSAAADLVPADLLEAHHRVHAANRAGRSMTSTEKRRVFEMFLVNEQHTIVGPSVHRAVAKFDWPLLKSIALRPWIRFSYFPGRAHIWFRNFASVDERIDNGLRAFDFADAAGWAEVESKLHSYDVLPGKFFADPRSYFNELRKTAAVVADA